ncbi:SDR family NAD(P)-dependent oxidoreductase, partial [Klebsiella pneumoniae]|nr:SDR family NAD(P)-dependent oxidoreductase [Klebsiella pneumoniae]
NAEDAGRQLLQLTEKLGGIRLYFHVSGIGKQNLPLQQDIEMNTVETNALGFTRCITTIFNHMADNGGGHIAAISSIAGTKGLG